MKSQSHDADVFRTNNCEIVVYSFIKSQVTDRTCLQSKYKLYEIRPTGPARRLGTLFVSMKFQSYDADVFRTNNCEIG